MDSDDAIHVEHLGKRYRLGQRIDLTRTFRETLSTLPRHWARKVKDAKDGWTTRAASRTGDASPEERDPDTPPGTFWALREATFAIRQGDAVGLIGPNGAGKSTLLKLLSRITSPTEGRAVLRGRIASLLEVGTGFNAELTGLENIYLNAAILGMRRAEIDKQMDSIIEFSGVERFLNTPIKRFSTGMSVRLAFAIAAHVESEIVLVDEVLAVGDAEFQRKCLGKMKDMATLGRTVIFVSHNMSSVRNLCRSAVELEKGRVVRMGPVDEVIQHYLERAGGQGNEVTWPDPRVAPGNERVRLHAVRVLKTDGDPCRVADISEPFVIEVEYDNRLQGNPLHVSITLINHEDAYVLTSISYTDSKWHQKPHPAGRYRSRCHIPGKLLNKGLYFSNVQILERGGYVSVHVSRIISFELVDLHAERQTYGQWLGVIKPEFEWDTERIDAGA